MRVLVLGASGLLGHTLYRRWSARPGWRVSGTYNGYPVAGLTHLNLLEAGAAEALIREVRPDIAVVPASNPHVDYCEQNPEETERLNFEATVSAARAVVAGGGRFLFFSSDYVFDGKQTSYDESAPTDPINVYGRQKLKVETALAEFGDRALVARVSGLYGWEFRPKNFVHQVVSRLRKGEPVQAAVDQDYNPTYVEDLAEALPVLLEKQVAGVLHLVGADSLTRLEFAQAAAEAFGFDPKKVAGVPSSQLIRPGAAARPEHSSLSAAKAATLLGAPIPGARASLKRMAAEQVDWESYVAGIGPGTEVTT
jgi:dTDP-4-dehydrorhamnose reductase